MADDPIIDIDPSAFSKSRNRKTPGLFSKQMGKVREFSRSYAVVLTFTLSYKQPP